VKDLSRTRVLGVAHGHPPLGFVVLIVDLLYRKMSHELMGRRAVPVVLSGLEEDPITGVNHLDGTAPQLDDPESLRDPDSLSVKMRVPGGAPAGREVDGERAQA